VDRFDIAIIGAGTAGIAAAQTAAALGARPVLIERRRIGGECTWSGCVPSKALIEAARRRRHADQAPEFGIRVGEVSVDFPAVMARVREIVERIAGFEDAGHQEAMGIAVRRGDAVIEGPSRLTVDGAPLEAGKIIICTGSHPAAPPIEGLADTPHLDNENLFEITELPRRLLILGAGTIGVEMAQAFRRLGSEVDVVDAMATVLEREDPDISAIAGRILEEEGIRFTLGASVESVSSHQGRPRMTLSVQGERRTLDGDALLVAAGRRPRIAGLGLEQIGVATDQRGVTIDDRCRTSVPGIYAAGDVTGLHPYTHAACYRVIPWVTFMDPEVGHLGLTEPEARHAYRDTEVATLPFTAIDRAVIQGSVRGLIKVITRGKPIIGTRYGGGQIIGAHVIGPGAGDLLHEFAIAMQSRSFTGRLAQTVHAYPTMATGVQQAVAQLFPLGRAVAGDLRLSLDPYSAGSSSKDSELMQ
jgi:pyruvate/2-oxoglutarate dehydrogenase complex dihydrolipoamide dehydrogenase (E3) component